MHKYIADLKLSKFSKMIIICHITSMLVMHVTGQKCLKWTRESRVLTKIYFISISKTLKK